MYSVLGHQHLEARYIHGLSRLSPKIVYDLWPGVYIPVGHPVIFRRSVVTVYCSPYSVYCILSPLNTVYFAKAELSSGGPWVFASCVPVGQKNGPFQTIQSCTYSVTPYGVRRVHTKYDVYPRLPLTSLSLLFLSYTYCSFAISRWRVRNSRRICISRHHGARPNWTLPGSLPGGDAIPRRRGIYRWPLLQKHQLWQQHLFLLLAMSSRRVEI